MMVVGSLKRFSVWRKSLRSFQDSSVAKVHTAIFEVMVKSNNAGGV